MQGLFTNSLFGLLFGVLFGLLGIFIFTTFWYRDRANKAQDELLELANKNGFFTKKPSVMRDDENQLFSLLLQDYGGKYFIFPQIHLSGILNIKEEFKDHDNLYRAIDHRSVDFVFFDKQRLSPILAIELNGESHFRLTRRNRDEVVKDILEKANIQFLSIQKQAAYNQDTLKRSIDEKLS